MDENKVRDELIHSLQEWGVTGSHEEHSNFRTMMHKEGLAMYTTRPANEYVLVSSSFALLKLDTTFPTNNEEAIRFVFQNELQGGKSDIPFESLISDKLKMEIPGEPFFRGYSKTNAVYYKRKPKYAGLSVEELDPLERFTFALLPEADRWFDRWFCRHEDSVLGNVFEAILACHALQNESCFHCKYRKCLRWNGGPQAAWQDLVCTNCNSTFEIKTKASLDKMEQEFTRNRISGGSFRHYWRQRNALAKDQKMFLVVLPRSFSFGRSDAKFYPVFCMEIDFVLPKLSPTSFMKIKISKKQPSLQSSVNVKLLTKKKWFDLPRSSIMPTAWKDIVKHVYIDHFSQEEYDRRVLKNSNVSLEVETKPVKTVQANNGERVVDTVNADQERFKFGNEDCDYWEGWFVKL
jgi:hypothetical protein